MEIGQSIKLLPATASINLGGSLVGDPARSVSLDCRLSDDISLFSADRLMPFGDWAVRVRPLPPGFNTGAASANFGAMHHRVSAGCEPSYGAEIQIPQEAFDALHASVIQGVLPSSIRLSSPTLVPMGTSAIEWLTAERTAALSGAEFDIPCATQSPSEEEVSVEAEFRGKMIVRARLGLAALVTGFAVLAYLSM